MAVVALEIEKENRNIDKIFSLGLRLQSHTALKKKQKAI